MLLPCCVLGSNILIGHFDRNFASLCSVGTSVPLDNFLLWCNKRGVCSSSGKLKLLVMRTIYLIPKAYEIWSFAVLFVFFLALLPFSLASVHAAQETRNSGKFGWAALQAQGVVDVVQVRAQMIKHMIGVTQHNRHVTTHAMGPVHPSCQKSTNKKKCCYYGGTLSWQWLRMDIALTASGGFYSSISISREHNLQTIRPRSRGDTAMVSGLDIGHDTRRATGVPSCRMPSRATDRPRGNPAVGKRHS